MGARNLLEIDVGVGKAAGIEVRPPMFPRRLHHGGKKLVDNGGPLHFIWGTVVITFVASCRTAGRPCLEILVDKCGYPRPVGRKVRCSVEPAIVALHMGRASFADGR